MREKYIIISTDRKKKKNKEIQYAFMIKKKNQQKGTLP
jgi:hypothetical protein